jgi:hypothetical protein
MHASSDINNGIQPLNTIAKSLYAGVKVAADKAG